MIEKLDITFATLNLNITQDDGTGDTFGHYFAKKIVNWDTEMYVDICRNFSDCIFNYDGLSPVHVACELNNYKYLELMTRMVISIILFP